MLEDMAMRGLREETQRDDIRVTGLRRQLTKFPNSTPRKGYLSLSGRELRVGRSPLGRQEPNAFDNECLLIPPLVQKAALLFTAKFGHY